MNHNWFVIMDERSIEDSTLLLAGYDRETGSVDTVRAVSERANDAILAHSAGVGWIGQDRQIARKQADNVLR